VTKTHSKNKSICTFGFGKEMLFVENWPKIANFGFKATQQPVKANLRIHHAAL